jgi:hypothetical protein
MKLRRVEGAGYSFHCPGCGQHHVFYTEGDGPKWSFNGDTDRPTFSPSLKNSHPGQPAVEDPEKPEEAIPAFCCHLHVENGVLKYCPDCTHAFAGLNVPMEDVEGHGV